ncbi:MAG: hypothetical protein AAF656_05665 [Planctomycetota bacterium]
MRDASSILLAIVAAAGVGFAAADDDAEVLLDFDYAPRADTVFNAPLDFDDANELSGLTAESDGASLTVFDANGATGGAATGDFTYWMDPTDFSDGATFELELATLDGNEVTSIGLSLQQDGDHDEGSFEFAADAGEATATVTLAAGNELTRVTGIKFKFYQDVFNATPNLELRVLRVTPGS